MEVLKHSFSCGDSIKYAIKKSLEISKDKNKIVEFCFNEIKLRVNHKVDDESNLFSFWENACNERTKKYLRSDEYAKKVVKENKELEINQKRVDVLMSNIPFEDYFNLIVWLKEFSEAADYIGVSFDKNYFLKEFKSNGFKNNEYVGYKGDWENEQLVKYTIGQVINCIKTFGKPHPITVKFCDDLLAREDFKQKEVQF